MLIGILSLLAGVIACFIGAWRQYCLYIEDKAAIPAVYLPALWSFPAWIISWVLVVIFSLAFANGLANVDDTEFWILLVLRWFVSRYAGIKWARQDMSDFSRLPATEKTSIELGELIGEASKHMSVGEFDHAMQEVMTEIESEEAKIEQTRKEGIKQTRNKK